MTTSQSELTVLYDLSYLGFGHRVRSERAGIHRVVENVARELSERPDVQLGFCGPYHLNDTLDFITQHPWSQQTVFTHKGMLAAGHPIRRGEEFLQATNGKHQFAWRGMRWLVSRAIEACKAGQRRLDSEALNRFQIYHSPWFPVPAQVRQSPAIVPFLTVYDLIPLLHPEYFPPILVKHFKAILKTITPETRVLCISESTKNDLCNCTGFDPSRAFVTPLAAGAGFSPCADAARQKAARVKYGISDAPYFLMLNTLEPRKNCDFVIRAFLKLLQQENLPELRLVLVGQRGWLSGRIFEEAEKSREFRDRLVFLGFVDEDDLAPLYSGAIAFIYVPFYEGFGLPPLEAMQCGVPVITSNTSSLPEVVGDAGLMISPTDETALCDALLKLVLNSGLRERLATRSVERASRFSWTRCVDLTIAAYRTASEET